MKNKACVQLRQGDVLLQLVDEIPVGAKRVAGTRIILAEGESTGHFHEICDRNGVALYESGDSSNPRRWLSVERESVDLVHAEHKGIHIPLGNYEVIRQREYQPEGSRIVAD